MDNFEDKVAVITGAASGMGLAVARRFAQEGMKVVLTDVEEEALSAATQALKQEELDVIGVQANVANLDEVQSLADTAMKEFGRVGVLCRAKNSCA